MSKILFLMLIFLSCSSPKNLKGNDYRLFKGTVVEDLAMALKSDDISLVDKLLKSYVNKIDFQEARFGSTLLMVAIRNNQYEMCKRLLENGANPNIHDFMDGSSAIIEACASNIDDKILELLLSKGANPNDLEIGPRSEGSTRRDTPLIVACESSIKKVELLVKSGANVNFINEFNVSALRSAYFQDKLKITLYLLNNGADYNMTLVTREDKAFRLIELLRELMLPLDSGDYQIKMQIVEFLAAKGLNYREVPIPPFIIEKAKKIYPEQWEEYLRKY